jgi:hypothetical protein
MTMMSGRRFVYIDGESHYIRSENAWRQLHGKDACLARLRHVNQGDDRMVLVLPEAKVFWTRRMNPNVLRATYFTSASGDEPAMHKLRVALRDFGLEPSIVKETKELRSQRQNLLQAQQLIEKPKGVDISLAVRMLEDSHRNVFDACHLYTSDVDFLPVIQAIKAQGKQVFVHGYRNGLAQLSPLLHEPDLFLDLEEMLRGECEPVPLT